MPTRESYGDWLRARDDGELRALLAARPELITPVPADLTALAARAATPAAASRALDRLDRLCLAVVEALLVLPRPASYTALRECLLPIDGDGGDRDGESEPRLRAAVERLRELGLVWSGLDTLRIAPGLRQVLPHPAGLGLPVREAFGGYPSRRLTDLAADLGVDDTLDALAEHLAKPEALDRLVDDAGPDAEAALRRLVWGPPVGRVDDAYREVHLVTATSPIERLLARGLLAAVDERTVMLPREVALHLRAGRLFAALPTAPPPLDSAPPRDRALVGRTAGGAAFSAVRAVEDLLERWGVDPPPVLRSGGLGVRDLRATAAALDVEEWVAALLAEIAYAAGLLGRGDHPVAEWLPTRAYDVWRLRGTEQRWYELALSWLETDRVPGLAGERDPKDRLINALSDELIRGSAPQVRRATLRALAAAPTGGAPDADTVGAYLRWREPRRGGPQRDRMIGWTLREAEVLGLTGLGVLARHGRAVLDDVDDTAADAADTARTGHARDGSGRRSRDLGMDAPTELAKVLPEPVDQVLLQADLTAVAPGPLVTDLARELALAADVESTGGATVYRFTPASVRRALDAGRGAADLHDLLDRHSATPVPQPLRYLVDDVARRHGHLRVGTASAYVRCDDPATLDEILADRRSEPLRVFRLAPTVLAARASRGDLLDTLRAMGYAPAAEAPGGALVITRPDARRADPSARMHAAGPPPAPNALGVAAAVRALRAGDEAARLAAPDGDPPRSPAMATVDRLRAAAEHGTRVWIGYLDQQGRASSRIVEPARVEGGFLTAYDATRAAIHRFALHRITGVAEVGRD